MCQLAGQGIMAEVEKVTANSKWLYRTVNSAWDGLNHLLWPAVCINCGKSICETDNNLCQDCWSLLLGCTGGDYCRQCGRDVSAYALVDGNCMDCKGREIHFDQITRTGVYAEPLKNMILGFKKDRTELDTILGFLAASALQASGFFDRIEYLVPVPLHWSRRIVRGYNQSLVLGKKIKHPSAKINTDLVRIRRTKFQPTMTTPAARARNVAGAFAVRRGHDFAGRNVCLIDDIRTTGATLNECARTLKQAGAERVFALVLAVAGQNMVQ
ncbi:MAG TPA: ComF family protein [Sedimentisphaerales bacterium]|nr:ComF family protein [Sedimentisphaerales bacterium]